MAYDPVTGEFKNDDELDVEQRINRLTSGDSKYMQQAQTRGLQAANRRGLSNSSLAVSAVESARLDAALPIATEDARNANSRYMQGRELQGLDVRQKRDITSTEGLAARDIASRELMQERDISSAQSRLETELGSRERLAMADNAAAKERLGMQLTQQEKIALQELNAAQARLETTIAADTATQERQIAADRQQREWLAQFDRETQTQLQQFDAETRQLLQSLDIASQERIANLNVSTAERNQAASMAASFEATYSNTIAAIMNNPELPSDVRQRYLDHAETIRESNLAMVEQMYGIDLDWGTGTTAAANQPPAPTSTPAAPRVGPYSQVTQ